jgi:protein-S-isoprenylcysteine O-methyltransferase Ste14
MKEIKKLIHTILSISGFVPEHMTILRCVFMVGSLLASVFILPGLQNLQFAITYFALSTVAYIGFISFVLPKQGFRIQLIKRFGEEKAYRYFEAFLAFAFFHNGVSLSFISQSSAGSDLFSYISAATTTTLFVVFFTIGIVVKIWSAYVVGTPIYYWKDMFLGKKVSDFVVIGPYKFLNNPMYGIGQLQVYAIALYYHSGYGLLFGAINQGLVFLFYFLFEKPFIQRMYFRRETPVYLPTEKRA